MPKLPEWILRPRLWAAACVAWFVILFGLSSFSIPKSDLDLPTFSDKIAHFGYFACGSFVLAIWLWLRFPDRRWWKIALTVVVAAAAVGLFDEWHQTFTPGRSGLDPGDWIADVCGSVAGWLAAAIVRLRLPVAGSTPAA